jgi:hypothetical protein
VSLTVLDFTSHSRTYGYQRQSDECLPPMIGRIFTSNGKAMAQYLQVAGLPEGADYGAIAHEPFTRFNTPAESW